jgi:hypothetical protein
VNVLRSFIPKTINKSVLLFDKKNVNLFFEVYLECSCLAVVLVTLLDCKHLEGTGCEIFSLCVGTLFLKHQSHFYEKTSEIIPSGTILCGASA